MFEVFDVLTDEAVRNFSTQEQCWAWIDSHDYLVAEGYDTRRAEDSWPEYESVMEMEKWQ